MQLRKPMWMFHSLAPVRAPRSHGPVPFEECKRRGIISHAENGRCDLSRANYSLIAPRPRPQQIWKEKLPTSLEFFHLLIQSWSSRITIWTSFEFSTSLAIHCHVDAVLVHVIHFQWLHRTSHPPSPNTTNDLEREIAHGNVAQPLIASM